MISSPLRSIFSAWRSPRFATPILPPELEREIFELAARTHPVCALKLVLVARRTLIWIEPLIYETVVLGRSRLGEVHQFLRTLRSRPASFFATHVKTLVLTSIVTTEQATRIASVCTGVVNLSCSVPSPTLLPAMNDLCHLRRLSIIARGRSVPEPDFTHPLYAKVTHLEMITDGDGWTTWSPSCFAGLPRLTHLALTFEGDATLENLDALDAIPPSLKVLAILAHNDFVSCVTLDLVRENFEDERVAFMREGDHVQDWLGGLRGRENMWTRAESIVRAQSKCSSR